MSVVAQYIASNNAQQTQNNSQSSSVGGLSLQIGGVTFQSTEIPQQFGPLGGQQKLAVHEFPGGIRTIQALGAFSHTKTWEGWLVGSTALQRSQQLEAIMNNGTEVKLKYGNFSATGYVGDYSATVHNQYMIRYRMSFVPDQPAASGNGTVLSANLVFQQAVQSLSGIADATALPLPEILIAPVDSTVSDSNAALQTSNGSVSAFTPAQSAQIGADAVVVNSTAAPLIAGTDATQASPAISASNQASVAAITASSPPPPVTTDYATNPNLYALAAQYYGDATQWQVIGDANGLTDPMPVGQFTLTIPQLPTGGLPAPIPQTQ